MIKTALLQYRPEFLNRQENRKFLQKAIFEMNEKYSDLDLLLLPEMATTGFITKESDLKKLENQETGDRDWLVSISNNFSFAIVMGSLEKKDMKWQNSLLFYERGHLLSEYQKVHLFSYGQEQKILSAGKAPVFFDWRGLRLSLSICYDLRFPELYRHKSENPDLILVAANWPSKRHRHWECLIRARAIENQAFVLATNICGEVDGSLYLGGSCIVDPLGKDLLVVNEQEADGLAELNLSDQKVWKKAFPVYNDRKAYNGS